MAVACAAEPDGDDATAAQLQCHLPTSVEMSAYPDEHAAIRDMFGSISLFCDFSLHEALAFDNMCTAIAMYETVERVSIRYSHTAFLPHNAVSKVHGAKYGILSKAEFCGTRAHIFVNNAILSIRTT
eukprot:3555339-Pleurochrysis_carterae.AAC.1